MTKTKVTETIHPAIEAQVQALPDNYLACRDMRHAYAVDVPFYLVPVEGGQRNAKYAERILGCMRCGYQRTQLFRVFKDRLEQISESPHYPPGYLLRGKKKGIDILGIARREQIRRVLSDLG